MDIISAYREVGTYRGAAVVSGTTHKTVKRVIARQEAGGPAARISRAIPAGWPSGTKHKSKASSPVRS